MVIADDIAAWRERIFSSLLKIVLIIGTIATVPVIPFLVREGMYIVAVADTMALAWIFLIWRLDGLSYTLRVVGFLVVGYVLAVTLLLSVGTASLSYLLGPPVIAAILLNLRPAMLALVLGAATIVGLGGGGHIVVDVHGWEHDPLKAALLAALNYMGVGAMLSLTCHNLLKGLSLTLTEARTAARTLEANQAALKDLNDELALTSAAVSHLDDMVLIARAVDDRDVPYPIRFVNDAFLRRTGHTRDDILGRSLRTLLSREADQDVVARLDESMAGHRACAAELMTSTRAGAAFWVEIEMMPFGRAGESPSHWVVVGRDITERRAAADAIHRLAFYDVLTGLPNRRLLMERLDRQVANAAAGCGSGAVLYLDLDNFKGVNDALGHAVGDTLLGHVATILARSVRRQDTVSRIGGDEFAVLLDDLGGDPAAATEVALSLAQTIRDALTQAIPIGDHVYHASASIGIALLSRSPATGHDLLREADTAMYHAKREGRNGIALFEKRMLAEAERRLAIEHGLVAAVQNEELAMHCQLQFDQAGTPVGAELLMRWRRADGSFVPPDVFIPIAEATGIIVALGNWALRQACLASLALEREGHRLPLSVNVSPRQFRQPEFVAQVKAILRETGAKADRFIFEVTEGLLVDNIGDTIARMDELAGLGIRFSIDDFGTGYSNLAYLKKMPLYELKIDKSFMRDTPHDLNGTAIVQSILAMAHHLGLRVVAEGIESAEQAAFLAGHGGAYMQGYLFHKPMTLAGLIDWLAARADAGGASEAIALQPSATQIALSA